METEPQIEMKPAWEPTYFYRRDGGELVRSLAIIYPFSAYAAEVYRPEFGFWTLEPDDTRAQASGAQGDEAIERFGEAIVNAPGEALWPVFDWETLVSRRGPWLVEAIIETQRELGDLVNGAQADGAFAGYDSDSARESADDLAQARAGFRTLHSLWRELRLAQWHIKRARVELGTCTQEQIDEEVARWRLGHGIHPTA